MFGDKHAAEFIWERCSQNPGEITLVAIGPLSNVALCLRDHPGAAAPSLSSGGRDTRRVRFVRGGGRGVST